MAETCENVRNVRVDRILFLLFFNNEVDNNYQPNVQLRIKQRIQIRLELHTASVQRDEIVFAVLHESLMNATQLVRSINVWCTQHRLRTRSIHWNQFLVIRLTWCAEARRDSLPRSSVRLFAWKQREETKKGKERMARRKRAGVRVSTEPAEE